MVSATKIAKHARRLSLAELQEIVGARSASLPDTEKESHPERSFAPSYADLQRELPDRWVAVVPTGVDSVDNVTRGHLIAHAPRRTELDAAIAPLRTERPELGISVFFTGRYTFGGTLAIA